MSTELLDREQWMTFFSELEGPDGCDFKEEPDPDNPEKPKVTWRCKGGYDKTYAAAILERMEVDERTAEDVLLYVTDLGGHCDCEILFNAARLIEEEVGL